MVSRWFHILGQTQRLTHAVAASAALRHTALAALRHRVAGRPPSQRWLLLLQCWLLSVGTAVVSSSPCARSLACNTLWLLREQFVFFTASRSSGRWRSPASPRNRTRRHKELLVPSIERCCSSYFAPLNSVGYRTTTTTSSIIPHQSTLCQSILFTCSEHLYFCHLGVHHSSFMGFGDLRHLSASCRIE